MAYKVTIIAVEGQVEHPLVYMVFPSSVYSTGYIRMWRNLATKAGVLIRIQEEETANHVAGYEQFRAPEDCIKADRSRPYGPYDRRAAWDD